MGSTDSGHDQEAILILRRLDASLPQFVTYKSLIAVLTPLLVILAGLGAWFMNTKFEGVVERLDLANGRIEALERRVIASVDGSFDRLRASLGAPTPAPKASVVDWLPTPVDKIPAQYVGLGEGVSPVGIYTLDPAVLFAPDADSAKLEALRLLLSEGSLKAVRPEGN